MFTSSFKLTLNMKPLALSLGVNAMTLLAVMDNIALSVFYTRALTVGLAAVGAALSFTYDFDGIPTPPKKKMYKLIIANTLLATAAITVFPVLFGWQWISPQIQGSAALLFGAGARVVIPMAREIARKIFRLNSNTPIHAQEQRRSGSLIS